MTIAIGGTGAQDASTYYGDPVNFGNYQYISIDDVINNFTAAYTGEGKILPNILAGDISFHAHRALQELNYDTSVSYTHLRAHETDSYLVCRLLLEKNSARRMGVVARCGERLF